MFARLTAAVAVAVLLALSPAHADAVADFYKGRRINLIVGYGPGGGYDVYARLLARHFGRFVPGGPDVIVQNMPGAGSLRAVNYLYNVAPKDGSAPLYQYAYGAYGSSTDPSFDGTVVSLLDRGFVYAIAHVRGGQELGRAWYDAGRLLKKRNTFTDFIDVTEFLVRERYAAPDKVFASGISAGGLLMGAVANMAPGKYRGIAAHVPFVDAVTTQLDESIPAILECWYLGQESGHAVAEVLFGDVNPGGKLPISVPRSAGHIPAFYNHKPSARRGYLFDDVSPLYAFGYGLSYTTFAVTNVRLADAVIKTDGTTRLLADVMNTGGRAGTEVVQMYVRDCVSSVTRPVKELKGFQKVRLGPGETTTVSLEIGRDALAFHDIDMQYVVEPGEFVIMVGTSSRDEDLRTVTLRVER